MVMGQGEGQGEECVPAQPPALLPLPLNHTPNFGQKAVFYLEF